MSKKIVVTQKEESPVAVEIIAQAIVDVAKGMRMVNESRLTRECIVTLIHERSKVARRDISLVLNNLDALEHIWLKPLKK